MKFTHCIVFTFLCSSVAFAQASKTQATEAVAVLLSNMVNEHSSLEALKASFAPSFAKANVIAPNNIGVDVYRPEHFMISEEIGSIVTAYIWIEGFNWIHKIRFKTVVENGRTYVMPSMKRVNMIQPWDSLETFVEIDTSMLVANNDFLTIDSEAPVVSDDVGKKVSTSILFEGIIAEMPAEENSFHLSIDKDLAVIVLPVATIMFKVYETDRQNSENLKQFVYRIENHHMTPKELGWTKLLITDVSKLDNAANSEYNYVIEVIGNNELRFFCNIEAGSLE